MIMPIRKRLLTLTAFAIGFAASIEAADINLPSTISWSAYPTGSSGYSQAVAVGSVLQSNYGVNLRVIPAGNDIARLAPLRAGRVQFAAGGSEPVYAQEGMLEFDVRDWGPTPLRGLIWNISDGCSFTFATAADANIETPEGMKGKRLTWVIGAPSLNNASRALLAYANLSWDDVRRVEVGGYPASVQAVVEGRADAVGGSCNSAPFLQIEASPRGLYLMRFPHDNEEAIARVQQYLPWYFPHVATDGPTIDPQQGIEVFTSPYPYLVTMTDTDEDLVYNMVKAMHIHYEDYKDNAPGGVGWAMDRQRFEHAFVPYHPGAVRYYQEIGVWTEEAQERQEQNLKRQEVLAQAWEVYTADAPANADAFRKGWMKARYEALEAAGLVTIAQEW